MKLSLDYIPDFPSGDDWFENYREWLHEINLTMYIWHYVEGGWSPTSYAMLGVRIKGPTCGHEVVSFEGEVVHDPYPLPHAGYDAKEQWTVFGILDHVVALTNPSENASL